MKCRKCFREIDDNKEYCNDCYLKYCEDVPLEIRKQQEIIEYLIDWMLFNKNKKYFEDNINIIVDNNNRNKIINPNDLHFKQNQQIVLKQAKTIQNKMLVYKNKISYSKPEINQEVEKNIITKEDIPKKIHKKEKKSKFKNVLIIVLLIANIFLASMTIHASYVPDVNSKITKREEETLNLKYNDAILKSDIDISKNNSINNKLSNLMNCLYGNINKEDMSVDLTSKINKLNSYFKEDYTNFAFYYEDLTTGLTMSFNDSQNVFAASVTKAPVAVYIYHLASVKQVSLDEKLTYTSNYYSGGTGILKNKPKNTSYTIRELVKYAIIYSDNIAHKMLVNRFGMNNIKNYWKDLGATSIFIDNTYFSMINAKDGSLYMKELYKFYLNNGELGKELMNSFLSVNFKLVVSDKYSVAHKYGWSGSSLHDMAIVFDDNPYILVVLSLKGNSSYKNYFNTTSNYVLDIHKSYWNERQNLCMSKFSS